MDFFTHFLISYLLSKDFQNPWIGVLSGVLPDFDTLLHPLSKRYKFLSHREASHSLLFVFFYSAVFSLIFKKVFYISIITGTAHLFCDFFTTWSVPLFFPLKREFKFDIDKAVNPFLTIFSMVSIFLTYKNLFMREILAIFLVYFGFRFFSKIYLVKKYKKNTVPTESPFSWYVAEKKEDEKEIKIFFQPLSPFKKQEKFFSKFEKRKVSPPISTLKQAKSLSYNFEETKSYLKKFSYPLVFGEEREDFFEVYWFALEMIIFERGYALKFKVYRDGSYTVKSSWIKVFQKPYLLKNQD